MNAPARRGEDTVVAGFMLLSDCAVLAAAREKGFAEAENLDLVLVREASWANIRDRIAIGHFDVAHMLAPMVIAANLGLAPLRARLIAPMALGRGGNAITVSNELHARMTAEGGPGNGDPAATAAAFARVLQTREKPPVVAIVHPYSSHHYELAIWLASAGLQIRRDVEVTVLPPSYMPDALGAGQVDAFCAGEPWGTAAVLAGSGKIVTTSPSLWRAAPGKVLGVRESFAQQSPDALARLVRALWRAALWCDEAGNRQELAQIVARPAYLDLPVEVVAGSLCKVVPQNALGNPAPGGMFDFAREFSAFPFTSHALWFYAQMALARQLVFDAEAAQVAAASYRPDLFRSALAGLAPMPAFDAAILGGPEDPFFDARQFDPAAAADYVAARLKPA